jgi:nitrogen PTS system EIIA component
MASLFPFPDVVLLQVGGNHPREILRHLTQALERVEGVEGTALMEALMNAEISGGSAIGDGVAVVSARVSPKITSKQLCGFARLARAVPFRGVETHPCDLIYVLVTPDDQAQAHLRDLSAVIRTLRDRDFLDRLRNAETVDRLQSLFRARDIALNQAA